MPRLELFRGKGRTIQQRRACRPKRCEQGNSVGIHELNVGELELEANLGSFIEHPVTGSAEFGHPRSYHAAFESEHNGVRCRFSSRNFQHDPSAGREVCTAGGGVGIAVPPIGELDAQLFASAVEHDP